MNKRFIAALLGCLAMAAHADVPDVVRDLNDMSPHRLTGDELKALMPGAKVTRLGRTGNTVVWVDEEGGTMFATSDNADRGAHKPSAAPAKWSLNNDRYCILINWHTNETESWCRYIVRTSDGSYFSMKSDNAGERVYKLNISR